MTTRRDGGLGTFGGVFTPSILTILGIILFLRVGYVVGNAGLLKALLIIAAATAVSVLTSISVAAIATNIEVKGGGDYYLISRTLGYEFGGAIGIVLFLAQSVSVGFYAIGFGEAVGAVAGFDATWQIQAVAAAAVALLFLLAWAGADVATKFQYGVMAALIAALVSFYTGAIGGASGDSLSSSLTSPDGALGFWVVFAIFFPAVTGFTQGVSMSGDLADPGQSLPRGTFIAVGLSTVVYVSVALLLAANATSRQLIDDTGILGTVASVPVLIDIGVIAATLSSAMASFLGGPRILQSLASDHVFPALGFFAAGHGPASNPRRGAVLTLVIAFATIALGRLDAIAPVVSMFFLISYGLLNYATYFEARASSPAFRPRFRFFNRRTSLIGALACLGAMLAINLAAGLAAVALLGVIYQYLIGRPRPTRWADASHSHRFQRVKESLRALADEVQYGRDWRPQVVLFSADPARRRRLLQFASWLEGRSGLTAAVSIMRGGGALERRARREEEQALREEIAELGLDVHPRVVLAEDGFAALPVVVQATGVGPLETNTALFGLPEGQAPERRASYVTALQEVTRFGRNVVAVATDEQRWEAMLAVQPRKRRIDVWWDDDDSGRLAALAAYLFTRTPEWSHARIRIVVPVSSSEEVAARRAEMERTVDSFRIPASVEVVVSQSGSTMAEVSADATIVFMPMRLRRDAVCEQFGNDLSGLITSLPTTAAFLAAGPIDLGAGPETGELARLAEAENAAREADERVARLRKQHGKLDEAIADLEKQIDAGGRRQERRALDDALRRRETVHRRVLKAEARAEAAHTELDRLIDAQD